ncbi:MAG: transcriptional coactivator p15/PC4 family protein [candidate division NC10 bacterium]|nr:transcriptional coactivator p15/PC4 family protein [candidate division NC10 bacterium]
MSDLVAVLPKNALEEIHVTRTVFKGKRYVDIRVFYKPSDGSEPRPTKKGVCLAVEDLGDLLKVLGKVNQEGKPGAKGKAA